MTISPGSHPCPPRSGRLLLSLLLWALFLDRAPAADAAGVFRNGEEIVFPLPGLAALRASHASLPATFTLKGAAGEAQISADLADRAIPDVIVIDAAGFGPCDSVSLIVKDGAGAIVLETNAAPLPILPGPATPPPGPLAAIEPGSRTPAAELPRIVLPEISRLRGETLPAPARAVKSADITFPVFADADLPALASQNGVIVARQSFAPDDATKASLYFSYRKGVFDPATAQLKGYRKMLVEVPLDRAWLSGEDDRIVDVPLAGFAIHTTEEREKAGQRWDNPAGYPMLGESSTGLYQGGQTVDMDDRGRIYITNVPDGAGIVRFNPHTAKFEQPPVNFYAECGKFLPTGDDWRRSWDKDLAQVVCARGRVFLVFDRNYRVITPNGKFETCSGVVSLPQDHWDDAEAFRADLRLHAASWPAARHPLYDTEVAAGLPRRAGGPVETAHGIAFGTWRLDLDAAGQTARLAKIEGLSNLHPADGSLPPTKQVDRDGLSKQRFINVGSAGRAFLKFQYGEFQIARAALALTLPGAPVDRLAGPDGRHLTTYPGAPAGTLTVRFDIAGKIRAEPDRYGTLAGSLSGLAQGPGYAVVPVPDEAGQAIGVCEYSYYVSKLDFSRRAAEKKVFRSYLPLLSNGKATGLPIGVGLGPYNAAWIEHDNARWLYFTGYTGMSRLKQAEGGRTLDAFAIDVFHPRLSPEPVDGTGRDGVKDFLHVFPALGGRLVDIGRGRPGRGGGAYSAGLELFDPKALGKSASAVAMNRCYGLYTPVSRVVLSATGAPARQEIFAASSNIRPEYIEDIAEPALRPANRDPKIFAYACGADGTLRDRFGFALPLAGDRSDSTIAFSPCRQYLVILQENGALHTYSVARQAFVDGARIEGSRHISFARPTASILPGPEGRLFFAVRAAPDRVAFHEVTISIEGRLALRPHVAIQTRDAREADGFEGVVRCFLPDLAKKDGSHDFVIAGETDNGGQPSVRVIEDFIPPAP